MIINGGESFFLPGGKHGVLLCHGFTATPAEMLPLGQYLNEKGFTVACMRLAGHSTSPEDMARMTWQDWLYSNCDGYTILAGFCDRISIVGQSMGGLLGLLLATRAKVDRVACLASPIYIHEDRQLYRLPPREKCANRYKPKRRRQIENVPAECNISYGEMPLMCVHELLDLIEEAKKALSRMKRPIMVLQGLNDHTVRTRSAEYIYERAGSYAKELHWLENSGHLLSIDKDKDEVYRLVEDFLNKKFEE